jgi:dTDP-4-amino-4,6-dideoxygalactose transaminase
MGGKELDYIHEAFAVNWISPAGPQIDAFEEQLNHYVGIPHVVALSSGTAALHLALILLGIGQGDEVICQSFTFCGSANPIVYQGATPVFIDSESDTWNMDPDVLRQAIKDRMRLGKKPKAIVYVHLYGMPAKVKVLTAVSDEFDIPLIEDAAEALGSRFRQQPVGSFGALSFFSFNGNKIITTSGGGALMSRQKALIDRARFLATQARDPASHYQHSQIGYNYRLSNVLAGIGCGQLAVIEERVSLRRKIYERYRSGFEKCADIEMLREPEGHFSNRWLTCVLLPTSDIRDRMISVFHAQGIEVRPLWKPMHLQPVYEQTPFYGSGVAEGLFERGLCLPSGSQLKVEEQSEIIRVIMQNI